MKRFLGIALLVVIISLTACSVSEEAENGRIQAKEDYYADIAEAHSEGYEEGYYACMEEHGLTDPTEEGGFARIEKEPD